MEQNQEVKYCVFIDVLGYGNIVLDNSKSKEDILKILNSIYSNLASGFVDAINDIHNINKAADKICIRSFSDSFYLHCKSIEPLIYAVSYIFGTAFNLFSSFSVKEERTPLLRAGIVKDWVVEFDDIGGMINKISLTNPVGLGVVRAYRTSEKSNVSGMRIIVDKKVLEDLQTTEVTSPFLHYKKVLDIFANKSPVPYHFKPIEEKEDLYELIWSYVGNNDMAYDYTDNLLKIENTFTKENIRHFYKTAQVLLDGLQLYNNPSNNRHTQCVTRLTEILKTEKGL
jgi:hypothetical protein